MKTNSLVLTVLSAALAVNTWAQESGMFEADLLRIHSRLQAMGSEYHSQAEWQEVIEDLDALAKQASRNGLTEKLIEVNLLQAMVAGDMLKDYEGAAAILEASKLRHGQLDSPAVRRLYARLAETYARLGQTAAVTALIREFEQSPAYDPDEYWYNGGAGPQDPVALLRPQAGASDSLTVTSMEAKRAQLRLAPGTVFPDFVARDAGGAPVQLADYRGKVLLLDFWVRGWHPWERALPHLVQVYQRYHDEGFDILGIALGRNTGELQSYLRQKGAGWRQVVGDSALPAQFGIYGEATNVLLDRNGVVLGRDLSGSDLVEAIKGAL